MKPKVKQNIKFIEFLIKAKKSGYAFNGEVGGRTLNDKSKEFLFKNRDYVYRDTYFGSRKFIGEEIVFRLGCPIWGMNYFGKILSDLVDQKNIYLFLKKAMSKIKKDRPFRGPKKFIEGKFLYQDKNIGNLKKFDGIEEIFFDRKKVYELKYHGGNL
jgi:hypothetical protein